MTTGTKAYLEDNEGTKILPATDWTMVQNKPTNLVTTDQMPKLSGWQRDGIVYENGAYDWDHVNNGYNCAYRIADMGSFKIVELRLIFGVNKDITDEVECIKLPAVIKPDSNEETWKATSTRGVMVHLKPDLTVGVYCQRIADGDKYTANGMISVHHVYFTTI